MATALLLHGITNGPSTMWRFQEWLESLGWEVESRAQIAHGGRGPADAYTIQALAEDNLAMGDHDLVLGHSLGGSTATLAASMRPAWAKRLVIIDPALYIPPEGNGIEAEAQIAELSWGEDEIRAVHPNWDDRDIATKAEESRHAHVDGVRAIFEENNGWDLRERAKRLPMPVLLISADPDVFSIVDPADARAVADANPNVTWEVVEGAAHNVHRDDPERVREILFDWLERTAP